MTISRFGRITPIQGDMLKLVGYRLSRRESTLAIPDNERKANMIWGRKRLCNQTGADFQYDLVSWHEYLIRHQEFGYDHPFAFTGVSEAVLAAKSDMHRRSLVKELQAIEKGAERIAKFGLLTVSQLAMLRLIGYRLSRDEVDLSIPDNERMNNIVTGRKTLVKLTGNDFGYSLGAWDHFLSEHPEYHYTYSYSFEPVKQTVRHYRSNKDLKHLITQIEKAKRK